MRRPRSKRSGLVTARTLPRSRDSSIHPTFHLSRACRYTNSRQHRTKGREVGPPATYSDPRAAQNTESRSFQAFHKFRALLVRRRTCALYRTYIRSYRHRANAPSRHTWGTSRRCKAILKSPSNPIPYMTSSLYTRGRNSGAPSAKWKKGRDPPAGSCRTGHVRATFGQANSPGAFGWRRPATRPLRFPKSFSACEVIPSLLPIWASAMKAGSRQFESRSPSQL